MFKYFLSVVVISSILIAFFLEIDKKEDKKTLYNITVKDRDGFLAEFRRDVDIFYVFKDAVVYEAKDYWRDENMQTFVMRIRPDDKLLIERQR